MTLTPQRAAAQATTGLVWVPLSPPPSQLAQACLELCLVTSARCVSCQCAAADKALVVPHTQTGTECSSRHSRPLQPPPLAADCSRLQSRQQQQQQLNCSKCNGETKLARNASCDVDFVWVFLCFPLCTCLLFCLLLLC